MAMAKRRRGDGDACIWNFPTSDAPPALHFDPEGHYFQLPKSYLVDSGLCNSYLPESGVRLFVRKQFRDLLEKLNDVLSIRRDTSPGSNPYTLQWILGSPGSGKSIGALSFAWTLSRDEWAFSWIHIQVGGWICLQVVGNQKKTLHLRTTRLSPAELGRYLEAFLGQFDNDRKHVLVLDGYVKEEGQLRAVDLTYLLCRDWVMESFETRRLVVVCSMPRRGNYPVEDDRLMNSKEFFLDAWKEKDYSKAVEEDEFFQSVRGTLNATDADCPRNELVTSKLYFAGGSCRYMFELPIADVVSELTMALQCVSDIVPYLDNIEGNLSMAVVDRGYDAVFVDKGIGKVRFVQLTVAPSHSFRIHEFCKVLTQLKDHMEIKVLEIFFLSPEGGDLSISSVEGEGMLMAFGWEKGKEKDKVTRGWLACPPTR